MKNEQYLQPYRLGTPSNLVGNPGVMVLKTADNHPNGTAAASFRSG